MHGPSCGRACSDISLRNRARVPARDRLALPLDYDHEHEFQRQVGKQRGRTSRENPPPLNPTSVGCLKSALVRARLEIDRLRRCRRLGFRPGRGRWSSGFRVIGGHMSVRGRDQADRAFGVVPPAVRIGVFLASVMQSAHLIFESRAVMLIDNGRRYEELSYEEIAETLGQSVSAVKSLLFRART